MSFLRSSVFSPDKHTQPINCYQRTASVSGPSSTRSIKSPGSGGGSNRTNSLTRRSLRLPDAITRSSLCPALLKNNNQQQQQQHHHKQQHYHCHQCHHCCHCHTNNVRNSIGCCDTRLCGSLTPTFKKIQHHKQTQTHPEYTKIPSLNNDSESCSNIHDNNIPNNHLYSEVQVNNKQFQKFKEAFDSVDTDNDGKICPDELKTAFLKLGIVVSEVDVVRMINQVDIDCNGTVEFDEFVLMMQQYSLLKSEELPLDSEESEIHDAFKAFDHNGDGFIDSDEIKRTMAALGETVSDSDVLAMIDEADVDQDGKIDFEEFKKIMAIFKRRAEQAHNLQLIN